MTAPPLGDPADEGSSHLQAPHAHDPAGQAQPLAAERVVATVPIGRLIGSLVLRPVTVFVVLGVVALAVSMSAFEGFRPVYLLPAFLGAGGLMWNHINTGYNFKAATSADGLRLSYGLLDTRHQTVPPGRVQAIKVSGPLLWRRLGW